MYFLAPILREAALLSSGPVEILARYPAYVLARASTVPAGFPADELEVLDDPVIHVHGVAVAVGEGSFETAGAPRTLVRFVGPIAPEWKLALEARGVRVLFWCPRFGACVQLPPGLEAAALREAFPFLAGARPYLEEHCTRAFGRPEAAALRSGGVPDDVYDLVCFSREDRGRVEAELRGKGIAVLASSSSKVRVHYEGDPADLRDIAGVKLVDHARPVVPLGTVLAATSLAEALGLAAADGGWLSSPTGRGEVVAVADTGLDCGTTDASLHADFHGRIRFLRSWPIDASWSGYAKYPGADDGPADRYSGHGTHVAGLALGDGAMSGGEHRGVAPGAGLVFQAIEQYTDIRAAYAARIPPGYYLSGRPLDLRELFREARAQGARIHVNAWGDAAAGAYTDDSFEADFFLHENPDAVVVYAAGNDGCDRDGNRVLDERTLYAPASGKNVLAVGATEGGSLGVGVRGGWEAFDPPGTRFRSPQERADLVSGEPDRIALISSTGPTADGRIKPDICAPGTNLVGPRSSVCRKQGWGLASPLPYYMYDGGTSMAAGVAGGFVALVREAWTAELGGRAPSGAALKALLVLGARPVLARSGTGDEARMVAGFGRLHYPGSAPRQPGRTVELHDEPAPGIGAGELRAYPVALSTPGAFRAVLSWYDAPGETLVNDLDLCLLRPDGSRTWGNHPAGGSGSPDRCNTVERIDVPSLPSGKYTLQVIGANVPAAPQGFALVLAYPAPPAREVPLDCVLGIGARAASRLRDAGVLTLRQLAALGEADLAARTGLRGRPLQALHARLDSLASVLAAPPDPAIPRDLTLERVCSAPAAAPAGIAPPTWEAALRALAPLALVFDRDALRRIHLAELF